MVRCFIVSKRGSKHESSKGVMIAGVNVGVE